MKYLFRNLTYADQVNLAVRELAAFIGAVKELFGPEQALLAAEDWLDESELLMDCPADPAVEIGGRSQSRPRLDWQTV